MKKYKTILWALMLLSVVVTAVMLQFMPDTIPAHYNFAGDVDRFGSKYESLLFPAVTIAMGIFFLLVDRLVPRDKNERMHKVENTIIAASGILTMLYFLGTSIFFMSKAIAYGNTAAISVPGTDLARFQSVVSISLGVLLILLGNFMPKTRTNFLFGVRTKWSMANHRVWQKSQRFSAITAVICGFSVIALAVFAKECALLVTFAILLFWGAVSVAASYHYYRKDRLTP